MGHIQIKVDMRLGKNTLNGKLISIDEAGNLSGPALSGFVMHAEKHGSFMIGDEIYFKEGVDFNPYAPVECEIIPEDEAVIKAYLKEKLTINLSAFIKHGDENHDSYEEGVPEQKTLESPSPDDGMVNLKEIVHNPGPDAEKPSVDPAGNATYGLMMGIVSDACVKEVHMPKLAAYNILKKLMSEYDNYPLGDMVDSITGDMIVLINQGEPYVYKIDITDKDKKIAADVIGKGLCVESGLFDELKRGELHEIVNEMCEAIAAIPKDKKQRLDVMAKAAYDNYSPGTGNGLNH